MADKPGVTTFDQLERVRAVQRETGRIWTVNFTERFEVRAVTRALELVRAGAIGGVFRTVGLGPHRENRATRAPWFYDKRRYGGILADIGSHQIDQFLMFTGATDAARRLCAHRQRRASRTTRAFEDTGEMVLEAGARERLRAGALVHRGRPVDLGRRAHVRRRDRGDDRAAQVRRHRRARRQGPPVPRRREGDAARRLQRRAAAVLPRPAARHRPPHRDGDAAGAHVQGVRARAWPRRRWRKAGWRRTRGAGVACRPVDDRTLGNNGRAPVRERSEVACARRNPARPKRSTRIAAASSPASPRSRPRPPPVRSARTGAALRPGELRELHAHDDRLRVRRRGRRDGDARRADRGRRRGRARPHRDLATARRPRSSAPSCAPRACPRTRRPWSSRSTPAGRHAGRTARDQLRPRAGLAGARAGPSPTRWCGGETELLVDASRAGS